VAEPKLSAVIRLRGVRHNNLKNLDLDLPLHRLIVITGLSGSGKSSLAFDTLYAEGQRRYIETFSPYARQFFDRMDKPQVDSIEGIPPAIAIEQRNAVRSTRSTVGTMTEICDHMKVLWPHLAQLHCRGCGQPVRKDSPQSVWKTLLSKSKPLTRPSATLSPSDGERDGVRGNTTEHEVLITFDVPLSDKLPLPESLALISKQGYQRLLVNGETVRVDDASVPSAIGHRPSAITVVQDRLKLAPASRARFVEACEQAYHFGKGKLTIHELDSAVPHSALRAPRLFSNRLHCAACDLEYSDPSPALFSFNHPLGACPTCKGFGRTITIDYDLAVPDRSLTLAQGAIKPWRTSTGAESQADLKKFCKARQVPMNVPFQQISAEHQKWIIEGDKDYGIDADHQWPRAWYGVKGYFRWLETKSYKMHVRVLLSRYRAYTKCPECHGARLKPDALLYLISVGDDVRSLKSISQSRSSKTEKLETPHVVSYKRLTLPDFYALPVRDALKLIEQLAASQSAIAHRQSPIFHALSEVRARLAYLDEVGLGYLTLDRATRTLSGGETERVNLTTCLGTRLVNTLFVLDEPSVGLHPRDTDRLVRILEKLRDTGNTVVVVEHEASVMRAADQIVDIGPGHGATGGEVVFQGPLPELLKSVRSLTGQYLSGRKQIEIPQRRPVAADVRRRISGERQTEAHLLTSVATLKITNATRHNLQNLSVEIPLGRLVAITGVSGSGKSTLVRDILLPALQSKFQNLESQIAKASDRLDTDSNSEEDDSALRTPHSAILAGHESLREVVLVDQSALGKTPRSNPAVYIGAFDDIREVFAQSEVAKQRGLTASAFSFNSGVGQCEKCRGAGFEKIEMQFLSDIFIRCPECNGRRYRQHILEVKIGGDTRERRHPAGEFLAATNTNTPAGRERSQEWSIGDMLEATVDEAIDFLTGFADSKPAQRASESLKLLQEVGLGYLRLGQPINTLSGGESQRLKLVRHLAESVAAGIPACRSAGASSPAEKTSAASELHKPSLSAVSSDTNPVGKMPSATAAKMAAATLFLFDEPTTGLHFHDVRVLLQVFQRLVDAGHSVLVIEHNLDVIKCADWVIDLGPDAGDQGGQIVAVGTPEEVAKCEASHTGAFLRSVLAQWSAEGGWKIEGGKSLRQRNAPAPSSILNSPFSISITGAREHNLKNISLEIPRDQFVVITGVSGSGKSTLAFDLLFAEGQRRFLDSMNVYARQFVEQMARPDVDLITGIPPTVSIEQRTSRGGGKSTVATVTEIYHFIRLLFARLGTQYCPDCQLPVEAQTRDELAKHLQAELKRRGDLLLLAPIVRNRKGFHTDVAEWAAKHGYQEIRADGKIFDTSKPFRLDRFKEHDVEIVVGVAASRQSAAKSKQGNQPRSYETQLQVLIDETLKLGHGTLFALDNHKTLTVHSTERACPKCSRSFEPLDPKNFSYNSAQGWCPKCRGFGELFYLPDVERGADADSIEESWWGWAQEREVCPECHGARLNPVARAVRLRCGAPNSDSARSKSRHRAESEFGAPTIGDFSTLDVEATFEFVRKLKFTGRAAEIARDIIPEIRERLKFLNEVGLGYMQLGRAVPTLSGGESQRIRLAAQLGSNLSGVLYVLDEPTIGLHARDNEQLLDVLQKLRGRGNSVVVVEHDEDTMRRADHIIDLGPGAGLHGGQVVASGTLAELLKHPESVTGQSLRAEKQFPARGERRLVVVGDDVRSRTSATGKRLLTSSPTNGWLTLRNAAVNNLKKVTVNFPLERLVVVTGVSGSGKSTLIRECLLPEVQAVLSKNSSGKSKNLSGHESLKAVYEVDQAPIGRTPRSIPATYVGFFDDIRALFAQVPEARMRGYSASRFSFNSAQGRCPQCEGAGQIKLEMNFLPPAFVRCETCAGSRFNRETLDIEYAGKTIAQVLDLSVEEGIQFFSSVQKIKRALEALHDTGLDYLKLGQQSPTLSGGEAQRVKLVTHLLTGLKPGLDLPQMANRPANIAKKNLFILEEPTIGLHSSDVRRLVEVLQRLVDAGHSVIVIEHNLDLIAEADWVIDLGPEGGAGGGEIVAEGTPEQIAKNKHSHTGRFLRKLLTKP
jgi:excinuclease ABC subunit A